MRELSAPRLPLGDGWSQVGMSDDGCAIYECDVCGARRVGGPYDHDCEANLRDMRATILARGDGHSLACRDDELVVDRIDARLRMLRRPDASHRGEKRGPE